MDLMTQLPRRSALALMAAVPAGLSLSALPLQAAFDPETALRRALAQMRLPMGPARLDLVRLDLVQLDLVQLDLVRLDPVQDETAAEADQTRLSAVVRMTWAPGTRQRKFEARAKTPDDAVKKLVQQIETTFAKAGGA